MSLLRTLLAAALLALPSQSFAAGSSYVVPNIIDLLENAPEGTITVPSGTTLIFDGDVEFTGTVTGSTVAVQAPITGDGSVSSPIGIDPSSATLLGPTIEEAELSFGVATDAELNLHDHSGPPGQQIDHANLTNVQPNQHHVPTVNTNAATICTGLESLRGNGSCIEPGTGSGGGAGGVQPHYRDDFTSLADGIEDTFTISTTSADNSLLVIMDGITQRDGVDYTLSGLDIVFTTAPASDTGSLFAVYSASIPIASSDALTDHVNTDVHYALMSVSVNNTTNAAAYEVLKVFVLPGTDHAPSLQEIHWNPHVVTGAGSCNFRLYDVTNAVTLVEVLGITTGQSVITTTGGIANRSTANAIVEFEGHRVGGGTTCGLDYSTLEFRK